MRAKTNNFTRFSELADYLKESAKELQQLETDGMNKVWIYVRNKVKAKYGVKQPWWKDSMSSPWSPLLSSWKLRNSVKYKRVWKWKVEIYTDMEWLAKIHEVWAQRKMTEKQRRYFFAVVLPKLSGSKSPRKTWWSGMITIPARPIWSLVLKEEKKWIEWLLSDMLEKIFK